MGLNLTMILSRIIDLTISSANLNRMHSTDLRYPVFYNREQTFASDVLYIARATELHPEPNLSNTPSLVISGQPPECYQGCCEYISIPEEEDLFQVLNTLQAVFAYFQEYEQKFRQLCTLTNHYQELGELARELFDNPVALYDSHEKVLFYSYDREHPPYDEAYMLSIQPGKYMPEEEWRMLHTNHSFTFSTSGPCLSESEYYSVRALYHNIRHDSQYLGRLLVDEAYRPIQDADYPLLAWLSKFIYDSLIRNGDLRFGKSRQFNEIISNLVLNRVPYHKTYTKILEEEGWDRLDTYICTCLQTTAEIPSNVKTSADALYLNAFFDSHCVVLDDFRIIQIFNLTRSKYSYDQYLRRLSLFLRFNHQAAGISTCFQNLSEAWYSCQQARFALDLAKSSETSEPVTFNSCALNMMLSNIRGGYTEDFYCSDAIKQLLNYDIENGTELAKTLRCYLENNMNYSTVQDILHIARTTALYRIRRVEEITGLDLSDLDTRLYLLLLFRLTGT